MTLAASLPEVWDREADDELVCIDVHRETHDVRTFTFASAAGKSFAFQASQSFMFECEIDGDVQWRRYSISSSPRQCLFRHRQARGGRQALELAA